MNAKDEETFNDYADGRLPPAERAAFEARLADEPALARRLRLLRATRAALSSGPAMPADLKAALKREARARDAARSPSWLDALRASFAAHSAAYGLSAAFAAAAVAIAVKLSLPARGPAPESASSPRPASAPAARWSDPQAAKALADLWSEDDGRDGDEG